MAEADTWPKIKRHGLLSTSALLDLFEVCGDARAAIESQHRPESVTIRHKRHGEAVIRDQKPMSDNALRKCLVGLTLRQWYETLNRRVFFWLGEPRLVRLLNARAYRGKRHCVITVETAELVRRYTANVSLSPINSGCTLFNAPERGTGTFLPISRYPFHEWRTSRRGENAVAELTVDHSVRDIREFAVRVCHMQGARIVEQLL